jgi:hypothetical protein
MAVNLLDLVKQGLPSNFADMAGKFLGESPGATQTALSSALPALLASIARQGSTPRGAQGLLSLLNNPAVSTGVLGNIGGLFRRRPAGDVDGDCELRSIELAARRQGRRTC